MKAGIVLCCALLTLPVFAGQMYEWKDPKTGKLMLGDNPPSGGTKYWLEGEKDKQPAAEEKPETKKPTADEVADCLALMKKQYSFKDPESLRVEGEGIVAVYKSGAKSVMLDVNGKNSYGAYAGSKPVICVYNPNKPPEAVY
jgi:hypothetical protein